MRKYLLGWFLGLLAILADFLEDLVLDEFKIVKTSKGKGAVLHDGYYYNHYRDYKSSTVFRCRHIVDEGKKKECNSTFAFFNVRRH